MLPSSRLAQARRVLEGVSGVRACAGLGAAEAGDGWRSYLATCGVHECFVVGGCPHVLGVGMGMALAEARGSRPVLWIGERAWPFGSLAGSHAVLVRSSRREERVWAVDCALRCRGVALVVADGTGLTMAESRRLQLAAEAGGSLGLLLRPPRELAGLSVARTRWRLTPLVTETDDPHWTLELLRCKGMLPTSEGARRWVVRRSHATCDVHLVPAACDRTVSEAATRDGPRVGRLAG